MRFFVFVSLLLWQIPIVSADPVPVKCLFGGARKELERQQLSELRIISDHLAQMSGFAQIGLQPNFPQWNQAPAPYVVPRPPIPYVTPQPGPAPYTAPPPGPSPYNIPSPGPAPYTAPPPGPSPYTAPPPGPAPYAAPTPEKMIPPDPPQVQPEVPSPSDPGESEDPISVPSPDDIPPLVIPLPTLDVRSWSHTGSNFARAFTVTSKHSVIRNPQWRPVR